MSPEKLVRMANQIAAFHASQRGPAASAVASHINDFWDPGLRAALRAHVSAGGVGLRAEVRAAVPMLRAAPD
ncbi:formate dehydrogenase subunit delta [Rhodobaculum claviforme]|uniref:Formate dehydrogenase n=1 Tax=Rhodobaculum claviforme TaxID=1549854 RepID=A0A934TL47_9RHOB|nr:formate dehydrogenase subunit delta [Rhodobaculum claviforme]MBK5927516.1 formate dehydrogenase [Rhodobaculum claviforme]